MDYRDEREALRGRVEALEQQLEEAKREAAARRDGEDAARVAQIQAELAEAEAVVQRLRGELSALRVAAPAQRQRSPRGLIAFFVLVIVGGGGWLAWRAWSAASPEVVTVAGGPTADKAPPADYLKDATSVPGKLKEKIGGPVRVIQLLVYPGYVIAEIQDPKRHDHVDRYTLRNGVVDDGVPVQVSHRLKTADDVDKAALDLATLDFTLVPRMLAEATDQLKIEEANLSYMVLDSSGVFQKAAFWHVYVTSPRSSGYVEFDVAGHVKQVYR